jgi:predicted amidophosphoribosyltransferase
VYWLTKGFLDLLFPPRCLVCWRFEQQVLCEECGTAVKLIRPPLCHRCGIPFDPQARGGPLCAACRSRSRFPYEIGRAAAHYEWPLREAVHRLKYDGKRVLGKVLGQMMADALLGPQAAAAAPLPSRACPEPVEGERTEVRVRSGDSQLASAPTGPDEPGDQPAPPPRIPFRELSLIVPVPLHAVRVRERGFNQAELLCGPLAQRVEVPIAVHCLQRVKLNPPQVAVPPEMRRANVRGAFAVTDTAAVTGRAILVFDDVWTTGATLLECARVLRQAGARAVYLLSLCRATTPPAQM